MVKFDYEKGLNMGVLAVVAVMLTKGVGNLNMETLHSPNLEDRVSKLDYNEFNPYVLYLMNMKEPPKKDAAKKKMFVDYKFVFVRYIFKLRNLNARLE